MTDLKEWLRKLDVNLVFGFLAVLLIFFGLFSKIQPKIEKVLVPTYFTNSYIFIVPTNTIPLNTNQALSIKVN
jgi:hypothetical protein